MRHPRPPFWLVPVAASFLGYFCLLVYCDAVRPEAQGLDIHRVSDAGAIIDAVAAGSPEDRAGLRAGDLLLSVDGQPIQSRFDVETMGHTIALGQSRPYRVTRGGQTVEAHVTLSRADASYFRSPEGEVLIGMRFVMLVTLLFGIVIAAARPGDPGALLGALLLASTGVFSVTLPNGLAVVWRGLPVALGIWLWVPFFCTTGVGALAFAFFTTFPARRYLTRAVTAVLLLPMAAAAAAHTLTLVHTVYRPAELASTPFWRYQLVLGLNAAYIVAGLGALLVKYQRLGDATERRRVRVLVAGSLIGWLPIIPAVAGFYLGRTDLRQSLFASTGITIGALLFLAFPISLAYSILRQRLLDLSGLVRLGVQYAFARLALRSLVPALALVVIADLFVHRDRPLREVVGAHGAMYLVIIAAGAIAHFEHRKWLNALDRQFFRERYNARRILFELVATLRQRGEIEQVAPRAAAHIEAALHPQFVAVLVRAPHAKEFHPLAVVPRLQPAMPMPRETTVLELMRVLKRPLEIGVGEAPWIARHLPATDIEMLRAARVELLVPIALGGAGQEAILALGVKRSEEPYSSEDQELLAAIAEGLALLLNRAAPPDIETAGSLECDSCGTIYDSDASRCVVEGRRLTPAHVPRVLAARYRLERRLGQGGMGIVYAATDTALDRQVAAKVMREEWIDDPAAGKRFLSEARAAARLSHPNIVTVHDFGVSRGTSGFLIMELLEGTSLRAALLAQPRMPVSRGVDILRGVASAVDAAHRSALVHRDLKPENVFLVQRDDTEMAKVVDFGIAKSIDVAGRMSVMHRQTRPGVLLGTPLYMAPEQLRGGDPQPSWDLWALAVIAFEVLTGAHPFTDLPPWLGPGFVTGENALTESPLAPLTPVWSAFFGRALAADPLRRPASAREWIEAFTTAVATELASAADP